MKLLLLELHHVAFPHQLWCHFGGIPTVVSVLQYTDNEEMSTHANRNMAQTGTNIKL